ncbi:LysR family transcriptional regulator [Streptomyces sp. TUS-ST3]|uniref:LysR family transcriptional regulator n=1 Tax=Streptomyces sp. TUS-ST3 TaxID=3025591 RepID=UPI00235B524B|nr:LysR substrate-binding domain-containing protein [Streptomyces sp. TUS-ST3]GLP69014.1 LysR family transcriptional regulator [Streptomyces sp. TUS-ST3]
MPEPEGTAEPSLHQLRLFLALGEELHFGRAAARLHIAQPTLSRQIKELEKRLGVPLFSRDSRSVTLTDGGRALMEEARATVEAMGRLRLRAGQWARTLRAHVVVGTVGAEAAMPYTHAVLKHLRAMHPALTVEIRALGFAEHLARLLSGDIDVAFLRPPVPAGVELLELATEPRIACLPANDPLAQRPQLHLADLGERVFVDVPPEVPRVWWDFWAMDPRPDGTRVRYGPVVSDMEGLLHTVATGQGICFLPAAARELFPRPGVRYVDVVDLSPSISALGWPVEHRDRPAVRAVREAATAAMSAAHWEHTPSP